METRRDGVAVAPHGVLPWPLAPLTGSCVAADAGVAALGAAGGVAVPLEGLVPTGAVAQASIGGAPRVLA